MLILALGVLDVVGDETAILAARLAALVELAAAGGYSARASGAGLRWTVVSAFVAVSLGSAVVLLKTLVHSVGPPDHADRGDRAQVRDQHPVDGESAVAQPVGQLVPEVPGSLRRGVARVPEDVDGPIPGEVLADGTECRLRLLPEGSDVEGEDLVKRRSPRSASSSAVASSTALPASTCSRFLRVAISIILGERSIAVIVPVVSLSQIRETATPWPQPTSSRRSAGRTSRVSTAQTNRSDALPAIRDEFKRGGRSLPT